LAYTHSLRYKFLFTFEKVRNPVGSTMYKYINYCHSICISLRLLGAISSEILDGVPPIAATYI